MKKLLTIVCLLLATICAQPVQSASLVVRSGNKYIIDGQTYDKKGFCRYIDGRDMQAYQQFKSGMRVANAGWGMFGSCLGLELAGAGAFIGGGIKAGIDAGKGGEISEKDIMSSMNTTMAVGIVLITVGALLEIPSIVCLGVGYGRMHKAADMYNVSVQNHFRAELRPATSGIGLALAW